MSDVKVFHPAHFSLVAERSRNILLPKLELQENRMGEDGGSV